MQDRFRSGSVMYVHSIESGKGIVKVACLINIQERRQPSFHGYLPLQPKTPQLPTGALITREVPALIKHTNYPSLTKYLLLTMCIPSHLTSSTKFQHPRPPPPPPPHRKSAAAAQYYKHSPSTRYTRDSFSAPACASHRALQRSVDRPGN